MIRCLCQPFPSNASARLDVCPGFGIQCQEIALDPAERSDPRQSLPCARLPPSGLAARSLPTAGQKWGRSLFPHIQRILLPGSTEP